MVGKEVQGFNESGNTTYFTTPSREAVFILPTIRSAQAADIGWLLKSTLHPKIYIENKKFPTNNIQLRELIKHNKQLLIDTII